MHRGNDRLGCCAALYLHLHWQPHIDKLDNSTLSVWAGLKYPSLLYLTEQWNGSNFWANHTVVIHFYREAPLGLVINQQPKFTPVMRRRMMGFKRVFYRACVVDVFLNGSLKLIKLQSYPQCQSNLNIRITIKNIIWSAETKQNK